MYIYNEKNCICYLTLKSISKDTVVRNNMLVYTMDVKIIKDKNTYGYKVNGHSYPSIVIFEEGKTKYQLDYNDLAYFENTAKYEQYIFERVNLSTNY